MNNTIKIEKNIPVPSSGKGLKRKEVPIYPFYDMQIGDSFSLPADKDRKVANTLQTSILQEAKRYRMKGNEDKMFTSRNDGKTIRIWRTK